MKTAHAPTLPPGHAPATSIRVFIPAEMRPQPKPHTEIIVNDQRLIVLRRYPRTLIPLDPFAAADHKKCRATSRLMFGNKAVDPAKVRALRGRFMSCVPANDKLRGGDQR